MIPLFARDPVRKRPGIVAATIASLTRRGLLDADGRITAAGAAYVEDTKRRLDAAERQAMEEA